MPTINPYQCHDAVAKAVKQADNVRVLLMYHVFISDNVARHVFDFDAARREVWHELPGIFMRTAGAEADRLRELHQRAKAQYDDASLTYDRALLKHQRSLYLDPDVRDVHSAALKWIDDVYWAIRQPLMIADEMLPDQVVSMTRSNLDVLKEPRADVLLSELRGECARWRST